MITVRIKGGLGNQLFQYAAACALAKRLNQSVNMDISFYPEQSLRSFKLTKLKIDETALTDKLPKLFHLMNNNKTNYILRKANFQNIRYSNGYYCNETKSRVNEWFFDINANNVYINGYFQSEEYFKNIREDLLKQFQPNYEFSEEFYKFKDMITQENSVAVHVRRGDFLKAQHNHNPHHYLLGEEYYKHALDYMMKNLINPQFYWFSDDIDWVKNTFGKQDNFHFVSMKYLIYS